MFKTHIFAGDHLIFVKKVFSPFVYKKNFNLQIERARRIGQHIGFSLQLKPEIKLVFLPEAIWFFGKKDWISSTETAIFDLKNSLCLV